MNLHIELAGTYGHRPSRPASTTGTCHHTTSPAQDSVVRRVRADQSGGGTTSITMSSPAILASATGRIEAATTASIFTVEVLTGTESTAR